MSSTPGPYLFILNKIKNDKSEGAADLFFKKPDLKIADFSTAIGDKENFLNIDLTNIKGRSIKLRDYLKSNFDKFPKKDDINAFFFGVGVGVSVAPAITFKKETFSELILLVNKINKGEKPVDELKNYTKILKEANLSNPKTYPTLDLIKDFASQFNSEFGERPAIGKWDLDFPSENIFDEKFDLKVIKHTSVVTIKLHNIVLLIKALSNPASPYLNNEIYFEFFENVITALLFSLGLNTKDNFYKVAKEIVNIINTNIGYPYAYLNCKDGLKSYTCGRAISSIGRTSSEQIPRLVIFNTKSEDDDGFDFIHYSNLAPIDGSLDLELGGDTHFYKMKYLKYKQKYLQLKNKL